MSEESEQTTPTDAALRVVHAEILSSTVMIAFGDGRCALFPNSFLRAHSAWFLLDTDVLDDM